MTPKVYTCLVSDDRQHHYIGQVNITVIANGELLLRYSSLNMHGIHHAGSVPLVKGNFRDIIYRTEGLNITLIANVTTDLPLSSGYPLWHVIDGMLPSTATERNYTIDGVIYISLSLYNLSLYDDSGNYACTARNECGESSVFTNIQVTKGSYHVCC